MSKIGASIAEMIAKVMESTEVPPDGDSHVIVMHPQRWFDFSTEKPVAEGLTYEPPGWKILAHTVVGKFRDIPIITSGNVVPYRAHLLEYEALEANVRRGLQL